MVVALLVERSLPIPDVRGSNPVIGKKLNEHLLSAVLKKTKIKNIEAGNGPYKKTRDTVHIHFDVGQTWLVSWLFKFW